MIWLLKNYRLVIAGTSILGIIGFYFYVTHLRAENQRLTHTLEVSENNYKICQTQKQNTEKAANEWEDKASAIDDRYDALNRRLRDNRRTCVPILAPASRSDAGAGAAKSPAAVGVEAGQIIDEARICDKTTERLISLQNYLRSFQ